MSDMCPNRMATPRRFPINKLCKQFRLITFSCSPRSKGNVSVCGFTLSNRAKHSASRKTFPARSKIRSLALEENFDAENTVLEEAEDHLMEHGMENNHSETERKLQSERYRLKMAILRRKYFKPEQETSLLTWEAKEQIRFLHRHMPDTWTVKRLAESYPCSESGIEKILESTYRPMSEAEIERHNRRTRKNWTALQSLLMNKGSSEDSTKFQHVLDENKLPLMINAGGMKDIPSPVRKSKQKNPHTSEHVGKFESIIKSYKEMASMNSAGNEFKQNILQRPDDEKLLLSIMDLDVQKTGSVENSALPGARMIGTKTMRPGASNRDADKSSHQTAALQKGRTSSRRTR